MELGLNSEKMKIIMQNEYELRNSDVLKILKSFEISN